jgi:nucleoside-diphosphate-sugar epimerase
MKSLVTGASGFIGGHLTRALVARGDEVRVLIRADSDLRHIADLPLEHCSVDLAVPTDLHPAVAGMDRIFHCAAVVADWGDPATFRAVNVEGTRSLMAAALDAGVDKFVHVSSTEVYGYPDYPATENAPYRYRGWPYCDTKIDAEKIAWVFARCGLPLTVIRPATVYGPRCPAILELAALIRQGAMMLIGGGHKDAGLIYVENLCDLLLLAGQPRVGLGNAFNASDGLDVTWEQFTNAVAAMLGQEPVRRSVHRRLAYATGWIMENWARIHRETARPLVTRMAVELTGTDQSFPSSLAQRDLGWRPRVGYEEGLRRVSAWLREDGHLV